MNPSFTRLGRAGLIPFLGGLAAIAFLDHDGLAARGLIFYGVSIISFLGGVHWGRGVENETLSAGERTRLSILSVCPSLAGWAAFVLPPEGALYYLAALFVVWWGVERKMLKLSPAYQALRDRLTMGAAPCLVISGLLL